jgi:hypothetical protein
MDTTRFSRVVLQLLPNLVIEQRWTPPASAAWYFNFYLTGNRKKIDTTGFSRVVLQF